MNQCKIRLILALSGACVATSPMPAVQAQATTPSTAPAPSQALAWHRSQLLCGVRVIIICAPNARRQSTFTFLPVHLGNDDAQRAQWSHLLEHMLIRTTDAEGLHADGVTFNGETTDTYLRLETMAEPARWKQALDRHARWVHAKAFDAQRLEREKTLIAGEEQSTSAQGFTDKFAIAAWNQIVTHNQPAANVHGDVQGANIDDVAAYAASRVRLDDSILIATIGPTSVDDMRAEIERLFAEVKPPAKSEPFTPPPVPATQPQTLQATWDLPTRHMLWWWPLPDDRPQTLAAATAVARALMLRVRSRRDLAGAARQTLVHPAVVTRAGAFLVLDVCVNADAKPDAMTKTVLECAAALCDRTAASSRQSIVFAARLAAQELDPAPDFAAMSKHVAEPVRDAVEGLWLLSQLNYEFAWNAPAADVRTMLMELDDAAVAEVLNRIRGEPRSLLLEPVAAKQP